MPPALADLNSPTILRACAAGASQAVIARALGVSRQRISQQKTKAERSPVSPVESYLLEAADQFCRAVIIRRELERPVRPPSRPFGKRQVIVEGNRLVLGELLADRRRGVGWRKPRGRW